MSHHPLNGSTPRFTSNSRPSRKTIAQRMAPSYARRSGRRTGKSAPAPLAVWFSAIRAELIVRHCPFRPPEMMVRSVIPELVGPRISPLSRPEQRDLGRTNVRDDEFVSSVSRAKKR